MADSSERDSRPSKYRTRKAEIISIAIGLPTLLAIWNVDKHIDQIVQARTTPIERALDKINDDFNVRIIQAISNERDRAQEKEKSLEADIRNIYVQIFELNSRKRR